MNQRTPRLLTRVAKATAMGVIFTGLIGLAHRPEARPALRRLGAALGLKQSCPFGYDTVASPEQVARARREFSASHAGSAPAPARQPVAGLEVGASTRAELDAWSVKVHATCAPQADPSHLTCSTLPEPSTGSALLESALWLELDEHGVLARVTTVRRAASAAVISGAFRQLVAALGSTEVSPVHREGEASEAFLSAGSLRQASAEYRFSNYFALIRATNVGEGYLLTEDYRAL